MTRTEIYKSRAAESHTGEDWRVVGVAHLDCDDFQLASLPTVDEGGTRALTLTMGEALMLADKLCAAVRDVSREARDTEEREHHPR